LQIDIRTGLIEKNISEIRKGNGEMAIKKLGSIQNGRYFENLEYGLWYDMHPIRPQETTGTDDLNAKIDVMRPQIHKPAFDYRPTIALLPKQWDNINKEYRAIFQPKVWICLYKVFNPLTDTWPKLADYGDVDLVCSPVGANETVWPLYTKYNGEELAYRWVKVLEPDIEPPVTPPVTPPDDDPDDEPDDEPTPIFGGDYEITIPEIKIVIKKI
jgi:hypothetical protein